MLVIDVGPMMDVAPPTGDDTPLESSLKIASQIVTQKVLVVAMYVAIRSMARCCVSSYCLSVECDMYA